MRFANWRIATFCICTVLASCGSSDGTPDKVVVANTSEVATDESFDGLRIIGDEKSFEVAIKSGLRKVFENQGNVVNPVRPAVEPEPIGEEALDTTTVPTSSDGGTPDEQVSTSNVLAVSNSQLQVTETNVQEVGVDEADRIKSDGQYLYILNQPRHAQILPIGEPEQQGVVAKTSIGIDILNGFSEIRVMSLDRETPDAQEIAKVDIEHEGEQANGLYLYKSETANSLIMTSSSMSGYYGFWGDSVAFYSQKSSLFKIDVTDPSAAAVSDSLHIDGQIVASRRIGQHIYFASRYFPWPDQPSTGSLDYEAALAQLDELPIDSLLPVATRQSDGSKQPLVDPKNCFVATKTKEQTYAPDIVTLAVLDLDSMSIANSACYLGASETLYASPNAIYLAATDGYGGFNVLPQAVSVAEPPPVEAVQDPISSDAPVSDEFELDLESPEPLPTESEPEVVTEVIDTPPTEIPENGDQIPEIRTDIHQFSINGGELAYAGSGTVDGRLGWNFARMPYRMGEKDGNLRVVTFNNFAGETKSPVNLTILRPDGEGALEILSKLPNEQRPQHIGKPGETLYASRFLGDKAYLVTFLRTDPLYIVDLADPGDPFVAGELEIPGFSEYLRPIGDNHLLGLGFAAETVRIEDSEVTIGQGLKISLFDVADPSSPKEVQSLEIGKAGTDSSGLYNPHAITVQLGRDQQPSRLALGINLHDIPFTEGGEAGFWYDWRESGLFGFEIKTDANAGISEHGRMIISSRSSPQPSGPLYGDDRSVIVNDSVFYVNGNSVYAANWNSLDNYNGPR